MAHFLEAYLKIGLSEIVVIDEGEREKLSGSYDHDIWETVVGRYGDGFAKVSASSHSTSMYKPTFRSGLGGRESITAEEYTALARGGPIIDTPEELTRIARAEEFRRRRAELKEAVDAITPVCPSCNGSMVIRSGRFGQFWGCDDFPTCKGTKEITAAARSAIKALDDWDEIGRQPV